VRSLIHFLEQRLYPAIGYRGRLRLKTLQGDGSDRKIYRLRAGAKTYIVVSHPRGGKGSPSENDSFYYIDGHLKSKGLPVPEIYAYDARGGHFLLEDFGDLSLERVVHQTRNPQKIIKIYRTILDLLLNIQWEGRLGFDPNLCYDTPLYDGLFSWNRESRYFMKAFLQGYLKHGPLSVQVVGELKAMALQVDREKTRCFLYRDFQSRNIMVRSSGIGLIDFQAGRLGPPQYDLASLLIDPYVQLPWELQQELIDYYTHRLAALLPINPKAFRIHYETMALQRNLQILGAFAFLSRVKGKTYFENYIPAALGSLKRRVSGPVFKPYNHVRRLVLKL
jgi:N-acetylmuramate 1-kinase